MINAACSMAIYDLRCMAIRIFMSQTSSRFEYSIRAGNYLVNFALKRIQEDRLSDELPGRLQRTILSTGIF
jgi:hypothetical protein